MNLDQLTKAQRRVFDRLIAGHKREDIADELCRSVKTIERHVHDILQKHGGITRIQLIVTYYQEKLREATSGVAQLSAAGGTAGERGVDVRSERPAARTQISPAARMPQGARADAVSDLPALMLRQDNFDHR